MVSDKGGESMFFMSIATLSPYCLWVIIFIQIFVDCNVVKNSLSKLESRNAKRPETLRSASKLRRAGGRGAAGPLVEYSI